MSSGRTRIRQPFLALEGINGAGKSSLRNELENAFWREGTQLFLLGQNEWLVPTAARIILDIKERRFQYPQEVIHEAYLRDKLSQSREILEPVLRDVPVLGDRSVISDAVYLQVLDGIPARDTLSLYRQHNIRMPDVVIHVCADPEIALERVIARARARKPHEKPAIMTALAECYEDLLWRQWGPDLPPVRRFVSQGDPAAAGERRAAVIEKIVDDWRNGRLVNLESAAS